MKHNTPSTTTDPYLILYRSKNNRYSYWAHLWPPHDRDRPFMVYHDRVSGTCESIRFTAHNREASWQGRGSSRVLSGDPRSTAIKLFLAIHCFTLSKEVGRALHSSTQEDCP